MILGALEWGVRSGIPLHDALETLIKRKIKISGLTKDLTGRESRWVPAVSLAVEDLQAGIPPSEALRQVERFLPEYVFLALKEAEKHDRLQETLQALGEQTSRGVGIYKERMMAFVFPLLELLLCSAIALFFLVFIAPKFKYIYAEFYIDTAMPAATDIITRLGEPAMYFLGALILLPPSIAVFRFFHKREPLARAVFDATIIRLPFLGRDAKKMALLDATSIMASLIAAGCDVKTATETARAAARSHWARAKLSILAEELDKGTKWADAWEAMDLGFPFLDWLVRNAGTRENPNGAFTAISKLLRNEISQFTIVFSKTVEVAGILFNALLAGTIVLGFAYGLFHLIKTVNEQAFFW
jgi:type II secretory pathway component PulF